MSRSGRGLGGGLGGGLGARRRQRLVAWTGVSIVVLALLQSVALGHAATERFIPVVGEPLCDHAVALGADLTPDLDRDGLSDPCEIALAKQFAPAFVVSDRACNWDHAEGRLTGGYLFGAQPYEGGVRVAYLPAYVDDCGWQGPKCLLRLRGGCDPHRGDSEFIAIDVAWKADVAGWTPTRVFLSAHCFGSGDDCRWYDPSELTWIGTSPLIWVAEGKNANYASRASCDRGHWHFDTCDRNQKGVHFPIEGHAQNIGSSAQPFPWHRDDPACVSAFEVPWIPFRESECIWTDARFRGWGGDSQAGSTGYRRYLDEVAGWVGR